jgi:hypothetical protein
MLFSLDWGGAQSGTQATGPGSEYCTTLLDVFSRSNSRAVDMLFSGAKGMGTETTKPSKFNKITIYSEARSTAGGGVDSVVHGGV